MPDTPRKPTLFWNWERHVLILVLIILVCCVISYLKLGSNSLSPQREQPAMPPIPALVSNQELPQLTVSDQPINNPFYISFDLAKPQPAVITPPPKPAPPQPVPPQPDAPKQPPHTLEITYKGLLNTALTDEHTPYAYLLLTDSKTGTTKACLPQGFDYQHLFTIQNITADSIQIKDTQDIVHVILWNGKKTITLAQ